MREGRRLRANVANFRPFSSQTGTDLGRCKVGTHHSRAEQSLTALGSGRNSLYLNKANFDTLLNSSDSIPHRIKVMMLDMRETQCNLTKSLGGHNPRARGGSLDDGGVLQFVFMGGEILKSKVLAEIFLRP